MRPGEIMNNDVYTKLSVAWDTVEVLRSWVLEIIQERKCHASQSHVHFIFEARKLKKDKKVMPFTSKLYHQNSITITLVSEPIFQVLVNQRNSLSWVRAIKGEDRRKLQINVISGGKDVFCDHTCLYPFRHILTNMISKKQLFVFLTVLWQVNLKAG